MRDVLAIGELLIDFLSVGNDEYPTLKANPGGAPANFLACLAHFGKQVSFMGKVGNDYFGKTLKETLVRLGINCDGLVLADDVFTTLAFVILDEDNDRHFSFSRKPGADSTLKLSECSFEAIADHELIYYGGVGLSKNPTRSTIKTLIAHGKSKGKTIIYDPNLRQALWDDLDEARFELLEALKQADIAKISIEELLFMFKEDDEAKAIAKLKALSIPLTFITYGADGAACISKDYEARFAGKRVEVKDTTGAGDIFFGSAISTFLDKKKKIAALTKDDLDDIVQKAINVSADSCLYLGGISSIERL